MAQFSVASLTVSRILTPATPHRAAVVTTTSLPPYVYSLQYHFDQCCGANFLVMLYA